MLNPSERGTWAPPWHVERTCNPLTDRDGTWLADVTLTYILYPSPSGSSLGWRLTVNNERGYRCVYLPDDMIPHHLETAVWQLYDLLMESEDNDVEP